MEAMQPPLEGRKFIKFAEAEVVYLQPTDRGNRWYALRAEQQLFQAHHFNL